MRKIRAAFFRLIGEIHNKPFSCHISRYSKKDRWLSAPDDGTSFPWLSSAALLSLKH